MSTPLSRDQLSVLALKNPWAAYSYLRTPNALPTMLYLEGIFTETTAQQNVKGNVPNRSCGDMLVWDLAYTVQSPTANSDNLLFKGQQDVFNSQNPNILALIQIAGDCPKFTITDDFAPIELQARCTSVDDSVMSWFGGWICPDMTVMSAQFINQRAFDSSEVPVNVWVAMRGLSISCRGLWRMPVLDVCREMRDIFGFDHPILNMSGDAQAKAIQLASPFPGYSPR